MYAYYASFLTAGFLDFAGFAGLDLPKEPWNLFPLAVFLSPLPMIVFFRLIMLDGKNRKTPAYTGV
jgi:hypothetical protein